MDQIFSKDSLPEGPRSSLVVEAIRVEGPFRVVGPHGKNDCSDGYVGVAADGQVYAVPVELLSQPITVAPEDLGESEAADVEAALGSPAPESEDVELSEGAEDEAETPKAPEAVAEGSE